LVPFLDNPTCDIFIAIGTPLFVVMLFLCLFTIGWVTQIVRKNPEEMLHCFQFWTGFKYPGMYPETHYPKTHLVLLAKPTLKTTDKTLQ